jgi:hypothetical protein
MTESVRLCINGRLNFVKLDADETATLISRKEKIIETGRQKFIRGVKQIGTCKEEEKDKDNLYAAFLSLIRWGL